MKTLKIGALALFSAASLAACDAAGGTGVIGLRQGQFEGEVSGVLDTGLQGQARSGYAVVQGVHDVIVLRDDVRNVEVVIYDSEDEFAEGRWTIDDEQSFSSRMVAYVQDLESGETFSSLSGTLDLLDVRRNGIQGTAVFTAESDDFPGDFVTVDVSFHTSFSSSVDFNRGPSFSAGQKD